MDNIDKSFSSKAEDHPDVFKPKSVPDGMVEPQPGTDSTSTNTTTPNISKELLKGFMDVYRRKQNNKKLSKEVIDKKEKAKKAKRRESNKSRKINQAKAQRNKFQRKK